MTLAPADWAIVGCYLSASLIVGLAFARRGRQSLTDYFVAGRQLSWWLAGTSIVATSFAADTPLAIARIVRTSGFQGNWYWWSGVMGFVACMFFFAPLWRRAGLLTDAELIELRYAGRSAAGLRVVLALHRSLLVNGITMGWVILGMEKIATETLGWPRAITVGLLVTIALAYTAFSGLWGVVTTDFFQFAFAMFGSLMLMVLVLGAIGGPGALAEQVTAAARAARNAGTPVAEPDTLLRFLPDLGAGGLAAGTFLFFVLVQWWGGVEGGGFLAQRLFATRNERHAVLALLWFIVAHFGLRSWPWLVVGAASLVYFPQLVDPETAYPKMMMAFLPTGLRGVMVAALLAAFMSTISTHLHWGASYLLNDIYRPYLRPRASEREHLWISQLCVVGMALVAAVMAWQMASIFGAWLYLSELSAGAVLVGLARWYWWRVTAWSEVAALGASLVVSNLLRGLPWLVGDDALGPLAGDAGYPLRFLIILGVSTLAALAATRASPPVPKAHLERFYARVRPAGWWGPVAAAQPAVRPLRLSRWDAIGWLLGIVTVYLLVFGLGWLLFGAYWRGTAALAAAAATGACLGLAIQRKVWGHEDAPEPPPAPGPGKRSGEVALAVPVEDREPEHGQLRLGSPGRRPPVRPSPLQIHAARGLAPLAPPPVQEHDEVPVLRLLPGLHERVERLELGGDDDDRVWPTKYHRLHSRGAGHRGPRKLPPRRPGPAGENRGAGVRPPPPAPLDDRRRRWPVRAPAARWLRARPPGRLGGTIRGRRPGRLPRPAAASPP
jgi:SSS family solute:Na+ symporter